MRKVILATTIVLLAGCATQQAWVHPTTGQANLASDRYRCEQDAARMYPPTYGQTPPQSTRPTTSTTNCQVINGQVQCRTIQNPQAKTLAETLAEINSQQDQNAGRRASAITSCLASMGYQYTTIGGQSGYGNQAFDSWERQQAVKRAARTLISERQTERERTCFYDVNGNQVVRTIPISRDCPWQPE